jgi:hypothetical protein
VERLDAFHAGRKVRTDCGRKFFGSVHEKASIGAQSAPAVRHAHGEFYAVHPLRSNARIQKSGATD